MTRIHRWLRIAFAALPGLAAIAALDQAHAQPAQVCSGLLPMAVAPPAGASEFLTGCAYHYPLKAGPASGDGYYALVDFPLCNAGVCAGMSPTGASTIRCLVANGYGCCMSAGATLTVEAANKYGPLIQGLQDRFNADTEQRSGICFAAYFGNGQRLLSVPVTTTLAGGSTASVIGFATAFMVDRPGSGSTPYILLEFQPPGVVAVPPATWGRVKTFYR